MTDNIDREPEDGPPPGAPGHVTSIEDPEETRLNRVITRPMLTFFILGDILGAGIYALTGQVAADVGGAIWSSFLISFLLALVTAFAYLELVTKYPRAAGAALYVHRAFRVGILSFMVTIAVMASGVTSASFAATRVGGRYWTGVFGTENPPTVLIGILVILLVAAVNYRGVGESIKVNIAITLVELSGLIFIILVGAKVLLSGDGNPGQAFEFKESGFGALTGITACAATAFYAFIGFEDSVNMAEEVRDPVRSFPPSLLTGIVTASIIYLLVGFTAAMTVPLDVLTESSGPLLEVVERGLPDWDASTLFLVIAMIAVSNTMLINVLMASRLLYGMANQGGAAGPVRLGLAPQDAVVRDRLHQRPVDPADRHHRGPDRPVRHHRAPADLGVPAGQHLGTGAAARPGEPQPLHRPGVAAGHRGPGRPGLPAPHQPHRRDLPGRHLPAGRRPGPVGAQLPGHPADRRRGGRGRPDHRPGPRGRPPARDRP
jgi:L-asparagine transporter-like permease